MHERLKEMAGKANFGHMENGEVVFDPRLEVFAELIIGTCCEMMVKLEHKYPANLSVREIKKYYGVE
jgi:hypothetical protein